MLTIDPSFTLIVIIQSKEQLVKFILKGRVALLLIGFVTRCLQLGLNLAQPLLVSAVTSFLSNHDRPVGQGQGAGLSIAYVLVYVGIAVSKSGHRAVECLTSSDADYSSVSCHVGRWSHIPVECSPTYDSSERLLDGAALPANHMQDGVFIY